MSWQGLGMKKRIEKIIKQAGQKLMRYYGTLEKNDIEFKNPIDLVTKADKEIENFLRRKLKKAFPYVGFIGEEGGMSGENKNKIFIVDPLDGTTNFVHTYPFFAISLGYRENNITKMGFVYLPYFKTMYFAEKGKGAFKNKKKLIVSKTKNLINALTVTGFACVRSNKKPDNLPILNKIIYKVRGVRRDGSAAIDLCFVAEGIFDAFWELNLNSWDIAAGVLIVQEAGGLVTDFSNNFEFEKKKEILATNSYIHNNLLNIIKESF